MRSAQKGSHDMSKDTARLSVTSKINMQQSANGENKQRIGILGLSSWRHTLLGLPMSPNVGQCEKYKIKKKKTYLFKVKSNEWEALVCLKRNIYCSIRFQWRIIYLNAYPVYPKCMGHFSSFFLATLLCWNHFTGLTKWLIGRVDTRIERTHSAINVKVSHKRIHKKSVEHR